MTAGQTPRLNRPGGVRAAMSLLILIPILVPLFAAALIWLSERESLRATEDRVTASARVVSANVRSIVEASIERLRRIDERLGPDPAAFRPVPGPPGEGLTQLYDATGLTVARDGTRGVSVADNDVFKALAAGEPWSITPLLGASGQLRFFGVARRLARNEQFAGAVTALIPADTLSDVWAELAMGPESAVGIIRNDGWLVTRYPVPAESINLSQGELFTKHLPAAAGGVFTSDESPIDHVPRIVGYQSLTDLGLIVTASMSRAGTADAFWSRVGSTSLVAGPVFVVMVLLCGWAIILLMRHERNRMQLQQALTQNKALFQEIHHRVKNNLQQVSSLIRLQQAPAAMKDDLIGRIAAMSAVHQHIYESDQFGVLDGEAYLAKLLTGLREAAPPNVALEWRLAPLRLSPDQALPLGMIVNEVISNAFKHGFPQGRHGKVTVALERPLEGEEAVLTIADNGAGMAETPAGGIGLGTRLIAGFVSQLEGTSSIVRDGGVRFEMRFAAAVR